MMGRLPSRAAVVRRDPTALSGPPWKLIALSSLWGFRRLTARFRSLPDFIVIGGQRCGTTAFYDQLTRHPRVLRAFRKEVHFFDYAYDHGVGWYRANFQLVGRRPAASDGRTSRIAGEATPYYLFHPRAPQRVAELLPHVHLIALVRNPVDRAYSHYHHERRLGCETLGFEEALAAEEARLAGEEERLLEDERYRSFNHQHFSYFARGVYADQLRRWLGIFPRERLLVLRSEDYYADPVGAVARALEFLGLPGREAPEYRRHNEGRYERLDSGLRRELASRYADPNRRLYELLGRDLGWKAA